MSVAGRWDRATRLLASVTAEEPADRARLTRAAAEVALDRDWFAGTDTAAERIEAAEKEFPDGDWDTDFLRLRHTYARLLLVDGTLRIGPDGRTPRRSPPSSTGHGSCTPGPGRGAPGLGAMYRGLITENHFADRTAAATHFTDALRAGEDGADGLLAREALRHLGDQDHDTGDHERAGSAGAGPPHWAPGPARCPAPSPSNCCWPSWPGTRATRRAP
ncbi:hypothetical protein O1M54_04550 [Streptomyces diastatochromogenes]|nr:hypothetical protein [Streptomyces diastatochromogenes]